MRSVPLTAERPEAADCVVIVTDHAAIDARSWVHERAWWWTPAA